MNNEVATTNPQNLLQQRLAGANVNQGAIAIEQERAIAEAQGQMTLAKRFPRDENQAFALLMRACASKAFAETAFYTVPNRGHGPSIRMAEEIARCYGNFIYGHRELSRSEGKSEIEVYAWDMERNIKSSRQVTVMHITDTKQGPKPCRDQADIDARIANVASKQMRGRILSLMPKWLVAEAIEAAKATLAGNSTEPIEQRVIKLQKAFTKLNVTTTNLEKYLEHPLKDITIDEIIDLQGVYNAINKGTPASDFFEAVKVEPEAIGVVAAAAATTTQPATTSQVNPEQAAARVTRKKAETKVEPKVEPQPEPKVEPEPEAAQEPEPAVQPEPEEAAQPANVDVSIGSDDDELF